MKPLLTLLSVSCITVVADRGWPHDEGNDLPLPEMNDLAQNRLFTMSTGQTMPAGKFSIADFEIFLLQGGYAPTDFLHFNLSYLTTFGGESAYWSVGTKLQVLTPTGMFKGLAIGADFGFFDELFGISSRYDKRIVSFNAAISVGGAAGAVHVNVAYLFSPASSVERTPFPTYVQVGTEVTVQRHANGGGIKLMGEILSAFSERGISGNVAIIGLRACGRSTVVDIGWPIAFGDGRTSLSRLPFFSYCFLF